MTEQQILTLNEKRKKFTREQLQEYGRRGGIASGITRRKKAAARKGLEYIPTECRVVLPLGNEQRFILTGYETERDLHKAAEDFRAFLRMLLSCSLQEILEIIKNEELIEK